MSLLMNEPIKRTSPTLLVPFDSWLFLQKRCHLERCGNPFSEKAIERLKRVFENHNYNGKKDLMNGDLGGCNGSPKNAWEEHRWTSWSVDDMAQMLDEAGLPYERGEDVEYIEL